MSIKTVNDLVNYLNANTKNNVKFIAENSTTLAIIVQGFLTNSTYVVTGESLRELQFKAFRTIPAKYLKNILDKPYLERYK